MRKLSSRRLVSLLAMVLATVTSVSVGAQPTTRDHRRRVPPPPAPTAPATPTAADTGPTEAPPTPREERIAARKGFVWIPGRWDWRSNKWEWIAGHWERERAGKSWREGRWERQGTRWTYVDGAWVDGSVAVNVPPPPVTPPPQTTTTPPPPVNAPPGGWPTSAPPPPRAETTTEVRPGFVWVQGEWDWRDSKWEWIPGHWERERAGKRWRASRWEQREGRWARVRGDWEDDRPGAGPGTVPPGPPPGVRPRREWKLEKPVISSYWPAKGKVGSRVVIKGRNFPERAELMFAGQPVRGVKIKDKQIVFVVPPNATTGAIALRINGRRELPVGMFEVAAAYDPIAEQKRIEEEQRRKAEAAWAERQKQLAKDKAAREAAWRQRQQEREATREQRRAERIAALQARWHRAFLADEETQSELTLHAQRVAEIERMRELAELKGNGKLVVRIGIAHERETNRHDQRMAALEASFKTRGGTP